MKQTLVTENAPAAIGPYSQGIKSGNLVFTSGQLPVNMKTGALEADPAAAAAASMENCRAVLAAAGATMDDVVKATVFITNMADFPKINAAYAAFFRNDPPARSCVQVAALPKGAVLEIELVAVV